MALRSVLTTSIRTCCRTLFHSQGSWCRGMRSNPVTALGWCTTLQSRLCKIDPFRSLLADLGIGSWQRPSSCSVGSCWKLFLLQTVHWFHCSSHSCLGLPSLAVGWGILLFIQLVLVLAWFLKRGWSILTMVSMSAFRVSAGILSGPAALPD
jgi:hypothetical protein